MQTLTHKACQGVTVPGLFASIAHQPIRNYALRQRLQSTCASSSSSSGSTLSSPTVSVALDPFQAQPRSASVNPPCWIPPVIVLGLATLFSLVILQKRERKAAVKEADEAMLVLPPSPEQDPRAYQRALAKTRQAAHITAAIAFHKCGEPARAFMELQRALQENSICRSPLLAGHHTLADIASLYKLHIKSSEEQPPAFAVLLQLQEMLGISQDEAEKMELEVLHAPGAFSI